MNLHYDIPNLKLTDDYLTDPILLALAWKRAHGYVRSLNWYADNFELDASSLFLQENCDAWANELSSKKIKPGFNSQVQLIKLGLDGKLL